ncbi:hypothetical protein QDY69_10635 [Kingella negevensis]|uniref:hypothetical protein n=1 Tax=Kingella negevensis TaxID=1522312 RepID=UPI00254FC3F4|nr:hypothetical protein [Kingella negevensis]MDK4683365.1 hypothetical protein [Kingella negevensis]
MAYAPNDFPPYSTVWSFYRRANQSGLWDRRILLALVQKTFNPSRNKQCQLMPLTDSQSVKTASGAHDKGFDGGKKIKRS